jgi:hypothetical protein
MEIILISLPQVINTQPMNRQELIGKTSQTLVSEDGESIQEAEEKCLAGRITSVKTRRLRIVKYL